MNKHSFCILFLLLLSVISFPKAMGQQNDFQCWPFLQLNLEVLKGLKVQVREEVRFRENSSLISRQINEIGLSYRINKYIKTALIYRIEADWKNPDEYGWRNGVYADVSLGYETGRFSIGYRLRMQSAKVDLNDKQDQWFNGLRNRHKVTVEYDIKGIPLVPFVEGEIFANLAGSNGSSLSAYRAWAGINYTLNKRHEIGLKYGIDQELNVPDPLRAYIIALGYTLNLQLPSSVKRKYR